MFDIDLRFMILHKTTGVHNYWCQCEELGQGMLLCSRHINTRGIMN